MNFWCTTVKVGKKEIETVTKQNNSKGFLNGVMIQPFFLKQKILNV